MEDKAKIDHQWCIWAWTIQLGASQLLPGYPGTFSSKSDQVTKSCLKGWYCLLLYQNLLPFPSVPELWGTWGGPCLPWNFQNLCKINNFSVLNANCFLVTSFRLLFFENYKDNNGMEGLEVVMYFSSFFLVIWYVFTFYRHEICLLKIVTCF